MARRKKRENRIIQPDLIYNSEVVSHLINRVMRRGKKTIAKKIVYRAFNIIKEKTKKEPLEVFELAIQNASPLLEIKPKREGGNTSSSPSPQPSPVQGRGGGG